MKTRTNKADLNDVINSVIDAVVDLEYDSQIEFPDEGSRMDFITDCAEGILDKRDLYDTQAADYTAEVLDLARLYGYLVD